GHENGLMVRVYGTKCGLEWTHKDPNYLWYTPFGEPKRLITRGGAGSVAAAGRVTRVPSGHPEGYLDMPTDDPWTATAQQLSDK
ncbi:hypothetical protein AB9F39_37350, partial [Rhizobium leguminosarum]